MDITIEAAGFLPNLMLGTLWLLMLTAIADLFINIAVRVRMWYATRMTQKAVDKWYESNEPVSD